MGTIKLRRGSGTPPASSLAQHEVAMDVADKTLYTSTDGTDAVILADSTEQWLANNTVSDLSTEGVFNETTTYDHIISSVRINNSLGTQLTAMEITRDLGSDGAVAGYEERCATLDFRIKSDATNTNNAPQNLYAGGFMGGSGSNDTSEPHWIAGFTYDAGNPAIKYTIFEGNKNDLTINPRVRANDGMDIEDPDAELDDAVLNIKVDQSAYNRAQIMCEDSNGKAFSIVGEMDNVNQMRDKFIVTLDPENVNSPNNITSFAGDYGIYYLKQYNNINNPAIEMNVFGAKDAFKLRVYDDANSSDGGSSGSPSPGPLGPYGGYGYKPMEVHGESFSVHAKVNDTSTEEVFIIDEAETVVYNKLITKANNFASAPKFKRLTSNSTTNPRAGGSFQSDYIDSNGALVAPTAGAGAATGWLVNGGFIGALICDLDSVTVDGNNEVDSANSSAKFSIVLYTDGANQQTGSTILTASDTAVASERPIQYPGYAISTTPPSNPSAGMMVYNTDSNKMAFYNGTAWTDL